MRIREEDNDEEGTVEVRAPIPDSVHDRLKAEKALTGKPIKTIVLECIKDRYSLGEPRAEDVDR